MFKRGYRVITFLFFSWVFMAAHRIFLVAAWELLVAACRILVPWLKLKLTSYIEDIVLATGHQGRSHLLISKSWCDGKEDPSVLMNEHLVGAEWEVHLRLGGYQIRRNWYMFSELKNDHISRTRWQYGRVAPSALTASSFVAFPSFSCYHWWQQFF